MHQTVYWCLDDIVLVLPAFGTTLGSSVGFDNTIRCVGHLVQTRFGGMIFMHRTEQIRAQTYMYVTVGQKSWTKILILGGHNRRFYMILQVRYVASRKEIPQNTS